MNLQKIFNLPDKTQKTIIDVDCDIILDKCQVIARREYNEEQENKKTYDGMCPKCDNHIGIVDKISFVQGKGSVEGKIVFGFGVIKGGVLIDTVEVNHCIECGNEWLKYKTKLISKTHILQVAFKYLNEIIIDPEQKKHDWKLETIQVFDGCTAEAMYRLNIWTATQINLYILRQYYKSVFDVSENVKLKFL